MFWCKKINMWRDDMGEEELEICQCDGDCKKCWYSESIRG